MVNPQEMQLPKQKRTCFGHSTVIDGNIKDKGVTPMNVRHFATLMLVAIMVVAGIASVPVFGQVPDSFPKLSKTDYQLTIDGTATLVGEWACGGDAEVYAEPGDASENVPGLSSGLQSVVVSASVPSIECGDSTMNKHLRKALKYKEFPEVRYQALKYTLVDGGAAVQTSGELTIAGVTRPVALGAKLIPLPGGGTRVVGKVQINMRDYGVKPPSVFFGALKVANVVTVQFDTVVRLPHELTQALFSSKS
jgi:polyisoprenoid-binding protein YceI